MEYTETYSTYTELTELLHRLKSKNFELVSKDASSETWNNPSTDETVILVENKRG